MAWAMEVTKDAGVERERNRCASRGRCIWLARRRGRELVAAGCRRLTDNLCVRVVPPDSCFLSKPLQSFGLRSDARHVCRRRSYLPCIWNHISTASKNLSLLSLSISLRHLSTPLSISRLSTQFNKPSFQACLSPSFLRN
jgi:hypothetical protein